MMTAAFYTPNVKLLRSRYEKNIKLLKRYPYLFRKDFLPFEEMPVRYYPYDDNSYTPFYADKKQFGEFIDFKDPVVSRNFFKDLESWSTWTTMSGPANTSAGRTTSTCTIPTGARSAPRSSV